MFVTYFDFTQTCLYIKVYYWTYFFRFLENLWDFIEGKITSFYSLKNDFSGLLSVDRTVHRARGRSTGRSIDVHKRAWLCLAGGPVDRPGRPPESSALWIWPQSTCRELLLSVSRPRSTGRSTDGTTVRNLTVGRSTGRSTDSRKFCWVVPNG